MQEKQGFHEYLPEITHTEQGIRVLYSSWFTHFPSSRTDYESQACVR